MDEYRNYIQLEGRTGMFKNKVDFMYVDTPATENSTPCADRLLMRGNYYWVEFKGDFIHDNHPYILVWCRVPSKHVEKFKEILESLKTIIPLTDGSNYQKFCEDVFMTMTSDNIDDVKQHLRREKPICMWRRR